MTAPVPGSSPAARSEPARHRWLRWALIALAVVGGAAVLGAGGFAVWGSTPQQATPVALAALNSGDGVSVTQSPAGGTFTPQGSREPTVGLVLYPGGHVDPRAYAPLAREVARQGYLVVVPPVPLALAFFDVDAAGRAMTQSPHTKTWAVGGHSLGGTASTLYVARHPGTVSGLVLLAAYPPDGTDLSSAKGPGGTPLRALSIRGSNDGLVTVEKIDRTRHLLPPDTSYVTIPGGNHAQFGSYGEQSGDGKATTSAEAQTAETAALIGRFLGSLE